MLESDFVINDPIARDTLCAVCREHFAEAHVCDGICVHCQGRERRESRHRRELLRESGISERHSRMRLWSDLYGPPAYCGTVQNIRKLIESKRGATVALLGDRGRGKSQLCCVAVAETIRHGLPARIIDVMALADDLKARFGQRGDGLSAWLADWSELALLCIDEIGLMESAAAFTRNALQSLIDRRYSAQLPTLIAGNTTPLTLANLLGNSVASRIQEAGAVFVCDAWPSFRIPSNQESRP